MHYVCDEQAGWAPDLDDIRSKVTDRTRAIVVINPNNPTGAVYPREVLEAIAQVAREHELIVMADEIYDKILYDDATHTSIASLAPDLLCLTFNGLSKAYRVAGFRSGWLAITGPKEHARNYIEGLDILANMRLCANVPAQHAIQVALGGYQSINELILPGGRLLEQRNVAWEMLNAIPGVSVTKPEGALYLFPRLDPKVYDIRDDQRFALDLLREQKLLIVHGTGFNWATHDHFRLVFLPRGRGPRGRDGSPREVPLDVLPVAGPAGVGPGAARFPPWLDPRGRSGDLAASIQPRVDRRYRRQATREAAHHLRSRPSTTAHTDGEQQAERDGDERGPPAAGLAAREAEARERQTEQLRQEDEPEDDRGQRRDDGAPGQRSLGGQPRRTRRRGDDRARSRVQGNDEPEQWSLRSTPEGRPQPLRRRGCRAARRRRPRGVRWLRPDARRPARRDRGRAAEHLGGGGASSCWPRRSSGRR